MGASLPARGRKRPFSEINVTPFVDVMLVLLIIFMVTAPLMQQGIDINLPETTTQALRLSDEPLVVSVDREGKVFVARQEVAIPELAAKLKAVFEARGSNEVFLRADRDVPYGTVVQAMAAMREAGSTRLGIVTEPER